jgi:hypothetical protein
MLLSLFQIICHLYFFSCKFDHSSYSKFCARASPKDYIFLNSTNRDFGEKMPSNSLYKWSSKYSHLLFWIFRLSNTEDENDSLELA